MRFAFFSPPLSSHLAVHGALAAGLAGRGHECFLIHHPDTAALIRTPELRLAALGTAGLRWSPGTVLDHARRPGLPFGLFRIVADMAAMTETLCRAGPDMLRRLGIDAVVADQMESAGALVAEHLGLPFVTVAAAVPMNREPDIPLPVLDWPYEAGDAARHRNAVGMRIADWLTRRLDRTIEAEARRLGCAPKRGQADCLSPFAELCQLLPGFDFPRRALPEGFHYVGPIRPDSASAETMPEIPPGKPFVFLSLGTMQGHRLGFFRKVAEACRRLGFRLMIAHCGGLSRSEAASLDADWVVGRVPQEAAIRRADIVVTHGGLNTVMDALRAGKPMLCFPLAFDQPGVGARLKRLGAGRVLSARAGAAAIAMALDALLSDPSYRERAASLSPEFDAAGGAERAAGIIEDVARGGARTAVRPSMAAA